MLIPAVVTTVALGAAALFEGPSSITALSHEVFLDGHPIDAVPPELAQVFPDDYAEVQGVLTFRGGPTRTAGSCGSREVKERKLEIVWMARTGEGTERWGGGAGWTGEPVIVAWPEATRAAMRLRGGGPAVEVIQGSLDGSVYFLDLATGRRTRPPLDTGNPIKGSVAVDPRGLPLLFVGQGFPGERPIGLRIYDLLRRRQLYLLRGIDRLAPRRWGAFDGSGLVNRATDSYVVGGENGLLYVLKLNSRFDAEARAVSVDPRVLRYRYKDDLDRHLGIESSIAAMRNLLFFADNGGIVQAVDGRTFAPRWVLRAGDDTDASLTVELEGDRPVLYTGTEVDKQGRQGLARIRKLDGLTGQVLWEREEPCARASGKRKTDGGLVATPVIGRGDVADRVVFTLARCDGPDAGLILALAKTDGHELWRRHLERYAWSSPTDFASTDGHTYLLQAQVNGRLHLLDARDGAVLDTLQLRGFVEASPAVYDDMAVIVTRATRIYGVRVR